MLRKLQVQSATVSKQAANRTSKILRKVYFCKPICADEKHRENITFEIVHTLIFLD